jgi:hypothetical protein
VLRSGALASATPFALLLGHLQAFSLADQTQPFSSDANASASQQSEDLAVSETRVSPGELVDFLNQRCFFDSA